MLAHLLLLSSSIFLGVGVLVKNGHYAPLALTLVVLSFLCLIFAGWFVMRHAPPVSSRILERIYAVGLIIFLIGGALKPPGLGVTPKYAELFFYTSILLVPVIVLFYLLPREWQKGVRSWIFCTAVLTAFVFRAAMPLASPAPFIDVFVVIQKSAEHLLHGLNPYTTPIMDVYGQGTFGYDGYPYPPASLYPLTIGYLAFGDARYTYVVCEAFIAFVLWTLARQRMSQQRAELLTLLFLYHPRAFFVLENAWTEPLTLAGLSLFLLFRNGAKPAWASIAYGYTLGTKQYLAYFVLHWLMVERRLGFLALGLATGALALLPFLLMDFGSLWKVGILAAMGNPIPNNALSIATLLRHISGLQAGRWSGPVIGAAFTGITLYLFRRMPMPLGYLFAVTITLFSMFLFGPQAFANHYYLVGGLLFLLQSSMLYPLSAPTNSRSSV